MRHLTLTAAALAALTAAACTSDDLSRPAPPLLQITTPERGTMTEGLSTVLVSGTVAPSPDSGARLKTVSVNGVAAALDEDGGFTATIPLASGANFIETIAVDSEGNQAVDTRALVTGTFKPSTTTIENAISAALSKAAFAKLGSTAGTLVEQSDLGSFVAPFNPVVAKGLTNGQEDCLYGKVSVRPGLDVGTATIGLVPTDAGLALDVDLRNLVVPLHARYAAACIDGDTDITVRATRARIRGTLSVMVVGGKFDVKLLSPQVTLEGFSLSASGVPGAVLDLLNLDSEMGSVLAWAVERFMAPMVDQALRGVAVPTQTLSVLGKQLEVNVVPAGVAFDAAGAEVVLDGRLRVLGSDARFVYTEDQVPPGRGDAGFALAVADDTVNQTLAGFWSSGAMSMHLDQDLGMYDGASLDALLPPVVTPTADGALRLALGDLIVDFTANGQRMTRVAMNVEMKLKVTPNQAYNGAVALGLEMSTLEANVLENQTGVPSEELEKFLPGMAGSMINTMTPVLGAIPLPSVAGISVTDLRVGGDTGYVTVSGNLN